MTENISTLQERFADEEALSIQSLKGEGFDPRYAFRRDPYELIARPQVRLDAGRLRDYIDTIEINSAHRFSNSLEQLVNAIALASLLSNNNQRPITIRTPDFWYLPKEEVRLSAAVTLSNRNDYPNDGNLTIKGSFFYLSTLKPIFSKTPVKYMELQRIARHISISEYIEPLSEDDLVIHLRSGDVFIKDGGHPEYGQPPLAYYRKIVDSRSWRSVHLVFEDKGNVVIDPLIGFISGRGIPLRIHSGTLESDLSILMSAKTLVAGIGSFIPGVASISNNIKSVYGFERYANWGNGKLNVILCEDVAKDYVSAVMSKNWRNLPEQRSLMISYPDESVVLPKN